MYNALGNMQLKVLTFTFDLLLSKLSSKSQVPKEEALQHYQLETLLGPHYVNWHSWE